MSRKTICGHPPRTSQAFIVLLAVLFGLHQHSTAAKTTTTAAPAKIIDGNRGGSNKEAVVVEIPTSGRSGKATDDNKEKMKIVLRYTISVATTPDNPNGKVNETFAQKIQKAFNDAVAMAESKSGLEIEAVRLKFGPAISKYRPAFGKYEKNCANIHVMVGGEGTVEDYVPSYQAACGGYPPSSRRYPWDRVRDIAKNLFSDNEDGSEAAKKICEAILFLIGATPEMGGPVNITNLENYLKSKGICLKPDRNDVNVNCSKKKQGKSFNVTVG